MENIRRLNKRVILQENQPQRDTGGGFVNDWQDLDTIWAERKQANGRAVYIGQQHGYEVDQVLTIRSRTLTKNMRFKEGERIFNIEYIRELDGGRFLQVYCTEGPKNGES